MDYYFNIAIEEAMMAFNENEVPVGAVIVLNDKIVSKAHNMKKNTNNVLNHAELIAIQKAANVIGDWRLKDCEMYVTLEPCPMCAGAIVQSRIRKVYIGTESNIIVNKKIIKQIFTEGDYYHKVEICYVNNNKCSELLSSFFINKRS